MTEKLISAPDISPGYPSKSRNIGAAWAEIWTLLKREEDYADGAALAAQVAGNYPGLHTKTMSPATLSNILGRAATAGLLDREMREVAGTRGVRKRAFYRIARES